MLRYILSCIERSRIIRDQIKFSLFIIHSINITTTAETTTIYDRNFTWTDRQTLTLQLKLSLCYD